MYIMTVILVVNINSSIKVVPAARKFRLAFLSKYISYNPIRSTARWRVIVIQTYGIKTHCTRLVHDSEIR